MMHRILLSILLFTAPAFATTFTPTTFAGLLTDIGTAVDGDIIQLAGGTTYTLTGDLTITESLLFRVTGTGDATFDCASLHEIFIIGQAGGTTTYWNCSSNGSGGLTYYDVGSIIITNIAVDGLDALSTNGTVTGYFYHVDLGGTPPAIGFQLHGTASFACYGTFVECEADSCVSESWEGVSGSWIDLFNCSANSSKLVCDAESTAGSGLIGNRCNIYGGTFTGNTVCLAIVQGGSAGLPHELNIYGVTADAGVRYVSEFSVGEVVNTTITHNVASAGGNFKLDGDTTFKNFTYSSDETTNDWPSIGKVTFWDSTLTFTGSQTDVQFGGGAGSTWKLYRSNFDFSGATITGNNKAFVNFDGAYQIEGCTFQSGVNATATNNVYNLKLSSTSSGYVRNSVFIEKGTDDTDGLHRGIWVNAPTEITECWFDAYANTNAAAIIVSSPATATNYTTLGGRNAFETNATTFYVSISGAEGKVASDVTGTRAFVGATNFRPAEGSAAIGIGTNSAFKQAYWSWNIESSDGNMIEKYDPFSYRTRVVGEDAGAFTSRRWYYATLRPGTGSLIGG